MRNPLAVGVVLVLLGCRESDTETSASALVQVKTATATIAPFADIISSIGTVSARAGHIASLSAPAPAVFKELGITPEALVVAAQAL